MSRALRGIRLLSVGAALLSVAACSTSQSGDADGSSVLPGSQEELVANVGDRVFFALDQYTLNAEARATLQRQASWLDQYPSITVQIAGNADERGTREYNLALGDRRANATRDYLVSLGVSPSRVRTISYGKERPVCTASTNDCWAQNRNGTTSVTGGSAGS